MLVIINDIFTFYIPNAFSPNGDGRNDVFSPYGISVDPEFYSMKIYDRWGKIIFQTTQYNVPWDGDVEGRAKREKLIDTYSYEIIIKDYTGIKHEYRGKVTLIY
jgi:gliding motility-associated-like protein